MKQIGWVALIAFTLPRLAMEATHLGGLAVLLAASVLSALTAGGWIAAIPSIFGFAYIAIVLLITVHEVLSTITGETRPALTRQRTSTHSSRRAESQQHRRGGNRRVFSRNGLRAHADGIPRHWARYHQGSSPSLYITNVTIVHVRVDSHPPAV